MRKYPTGIFVVVTAQLTFCPNHMLSLHQWLLLLLCADAHIFGLFLCAWLELGILLWYKQCGILLGVQGGGCKSAFYIGMHHHIALLIIVLEKRVSFLTKYIPTS